MIAAVVGEYDVIAIDLPGFGRSPALPRAVSPTAANLAAAIEDALDGLGIDTYHVAGYALGARVAIPAGRIPAGRSVFFAGSRSLPWQLPPAEPGSC